MNLEFHLRRSRRKTLSIELDVNAELIVKAPYLLPKKYIYDFIDAKKDWILKSRKKILNKKANLLLWNNEKFLYLGNYYALNKIISELNQKKLNDSIILWYKKEAERIFSARLLYFANKMNLSYSRFTLSNARKRWGSCNYIAKNIHINWRLIFLSKEYLDYVLVHELAHLRYPNHSRDFWSMVENYFVNYKEIRNKLKDCSYILSFI